MIVNVYYDFITSKLIFSAHGRLIPTNILVKKLDSAYKEDIEEYFGNWKYKVLDSLYKMALVSSDLHGRELEKFYSKISEFKFPQTREDYKPTYKYVVVIHLDTNGETIKRSKLVMPVVNFPNYYSREEIINCWFVQQTICDEYTIAIEILDDEETAKYYYEMF